MEKINIKICMGTTCFVMGGSFLQELINIIPQRYKDKVDVSTSSCLGICSTELEYSKAPYVKIDEEIITEATIDKVLNAIEKKLGEN
ncbi:NAD(P)H-dependent oxidoreductase subunit E [bacterium]|nr:NAD(P)H-dependent oxidoreductase subunit E [bacterium]